MRWEAFLQSGIPDRRSRSSPRRDPGRLASLFGYSVISGDRDRGTPGTTPSTPPARVLPAGWRPGPVLTRHPARCSWHRTSRARGSRRSGRANRRIAYAIAEPFPDTEWLLADRRGSLSKHRPDRSDVRRRASSERAQVWSSDSTGLPWRSTRSYMRIDHLFA